MLWGNSALQERSIRTAKMALWIPLLPPTISPNLHNRPVLSTTTTLLNTREKKIKLFCTNNLSDAELAADLASEVAKISTHAVQRKEAMEKSREVLFGELCEHVGMSAEEVKERWRKMGEEEKMGWAKSFVSEWGEGFHPLSSRSVKELVEEHLAQQISSPPNPIASSSSFMLPGLKRILGFLENKPK